MRLSNRSQIDPFIAMDVLAAANEREARGEVVHHLELGQPSAPTPDPVVAAATQSLTAGETGYTEGLGRWPLRQRIADYYRRRHGVDVDPKHVVVTTGSSGAFLLAFIGCFDAGDKVALARPGYPGYRNILKALDLVPVEIAAGPTEGFQLAPDALAAAQRRHGPLQGLLIASPANPTGTVIDEAHMAELVAYCRQEGIQLISDEVYHGITYDMRAPTALSIDREAVIVNSFSKYFCMTGWRIGWMVVPEGLLRRLECLVQNLFVCAPAMAQRAAVAAFDCHASYDALVDQYRKNRDTLIHSLHAGGITRLAPADGAFYLYADVSARTPDSTAFCQRLLNDTGVAITPGVDFDPVDGHRYVRLSFAGETATIEAAAERLAVWLR